MTRKSKQHPLIGVECRPRDLGEHLGSLVVVPLRQSTATGLLTCRVAESRCRGWRTGDTIALHPHELERKTGDETKSKDNAGAGGVDYDPGAEPEEDGTGHHAAR